MVSPMIVAVQRVEKRNEGAGLPSSAFACSSCWMTQGDPTTYRAD